MLVQSKEFLTAEDKGYTLVVTDTINYCHVAVSILMWNVKSPFKVVPVATQFLAFQESKDVETE